MEDLGTGMKRVRLRFGFVEEPDIPATLAAAVDLVGPLPR